jgi:hypothetical protein
VGCLPIRAICTRGGAGVPGRLLGVAGCGAEFRGIIDEHAADYSPALQHVRFGDLTRYGLAASDRGEQDVVLRRLDFSTTRCAAAMATCRTSLPSRP